MEKNKKPPMGPGGSGGPGGMKLVEKPKDFNKSFKKLFSYCKSYRPAMIVALSLAVVSAIFSLYGPSQLSKITDLVLEGLQTGIDLEQITKISTTLATLYVISLLFGYVTGNIMGTISQKISKKMRSQLTKKINKLPLSYFDTTSYGDTLSRITNDVDTIGTSLNQSMASVISGSFMFVGALILMFYTNWIMAISGLLATIIGFSLMAFIIKKSQTFFKAQQKELGTLNGHIEEVYTGIDVIKSFNSEDYFKKQFDKNNESLRKHARSAQFVSGLMMPIMGFVGNLSYLVVSIVGAILAMNGHISFGVIVAFMIYIRLFTQPLTTLAQATTTMQSAVAASERVFDLLEEKELDDESQKTQSLKTATGNVSFKNIKFGYNADKLIIKDFSADIKAGQKVAIVGPTGAGKTTLVNLLMRFYELNSGEINLDGVSISDITRENLHDKFAMVLQDTWMFEGTIFENIVYSQTDILEEDVINACKSVGIHHTIMTLPNGYHSKMSNSSLSIGEKQLLTIARAMVKKSDLLILDEATSSVDTRTELLIQKALDTLSTGKTSFIIAHRLSTIKNADVILVMKDGNIIENGNHEELLAKNGFYAELYNSQFEEN